ncbi:MAG: methionine adenosyltransferase [Phycisphaerae bacterium]
MTAQHNNQSYLFTSESVSMGHPDKLADQISDAILDSLLAKDPRARTAIETLVTTGLVVVAGEVTVHNAEARAALDDTEKTVREAIRKTGYNDPAAGFDYRSCAVIRTIHNQSEDISQGVTEGQGLHKDQGAGDQGLMFGYACDETESLMPLPIHLSHRMMERLAQLREQGEIKWLRPDAKGQVTVAYENGVPAGIKTVVLSTQHTEEVIDPKTNQMSQEATQLLIDEVIKPVIQAECSRLWSDRIEYHINPTGRFLIGGPHGDTGLTGRKVIVDTYGGRGRHGGGAFSGKDPTKVDRSACYMARHVAKNIVAAGLAKACEVQLAYAIGVAEPVSIQVSELRDSELSGPELERAIRRVFDLTPSGIIKQLDLCRPIYFETARHGHFGREGPGFTWEKTNRIEDLREAVKCAAAAT